jgi:predicted ATPase with chaperone activity
VNAPVRRADNFNDGAVENAARATLLAPRPKTLAETGLTASFVADLVAKHLYDAGVLTMAQLSERVALSGTVLDGVLNFMRKEAKIEVLAAAAQNAGLRYALTDRGRAAALEALTRGGYIGPAPVTLDEYVRVVAAQTVHDRQVTRAAMITAFSDVVLLDGMLDQLGPSLNSGRAIFIYGPAGTGKTYITQRINRLFPSEVLIPHAIVTNDSVVAVFDPALHKRADASQSSSLLLDAGHDPRWVRSRRPVVISGGELTADMLEISYDAATKQFWAPLQLKANNGIYIIDDMGRQRVPPATVFNRWIVPMEERKDYLSLGAGRQFCVPFDLILIFSTNMNPLDLADEAYLRRIGYKIAFNYASREQYTGIWKENCVSLGIDYDSAVLAHTIDVLHARSNTPLLPCHPRDLLSIAIDRTTYLGEPRRVTCEAIEWAWANYFVSIGSAGSSSTGANVNEG